MGYINYNIGTSEETVTKTIVDSHVLPGISLFSAPYKAAYVSPVKKLFVGSPSSTGVTVIDTYTNTIITVVPILRPCSEVLYGNNNYVYTASFNNDSVFIININDYSYTEILTGGGINRFGVFDEENSKIYFAGPQAGGKIKVIDTLTNTFVTLINGVGGGVEHLEIGGDFIWGGNSSTSVSYTNRLSYVVEGNIVTGISSSGPSKYINGYLFIADQSPTSIVSYIKVSTMTYEGDITLSPQAGLLTKWFNFNENETFIFCGTYNGIAKINSVDKTVEMINTGSTYLSVEYFPDSEYYYGLNNTTDSVDVFSITGSTMINSYSGFTTPSFIYYDSDLYSMYVTDTGASSVIPILNTVSFVSSNNITCTKDLLLSWTKVGREYLIGKKKGRKKGIRIVYFSLGDSDENYYVDDQLSTGFIPNITGNEHFCINGNLRNDITHKLNYQKQGLTLLKDYTIVLTDLNNAGGCPITSLLYNITIDGVSVFGLTPDYHSLFLNGTLIPLTNINNINAQQKTNFVKSEYLNVLNFNYGYTIVNVSGVDYAQLNGNLTITIVNQPYTSILVDNSSVICNNTIGSIITFVQKVVSNPNIVEDLNANSHLIIPCSTNGNE